MSATKLDGFKTFKKQLNALKDGGMDIDPDKVIAEINAGPKEIEVVKKGGFNEEHWKLLRSQLNKLLDDYQNFYSGKGRGIGVTVHITKENNADRFVEKYDYDTKMILLHVCDIGTKGKYEPVVPGEKL
jgi:hypothetical protein